MGIKVAVVDDPSSYSKSLIHEGLVRERVKVIFYGPRAMSNTLDSESEFFRSERVWTGHQYPVQILRQALVDKPDVIHIQYEMNTFGRFYTNLLFPFLLLLLKLTNSKIVVTFHSTLTGKETGTVLLSLPVPRVLIRLVLIVFYKLIQKLVDMVVVHDSTFKDTLVKYYRFKGSKITVIPHGVSTDNSSHRVTKPNQLFSRLRRRRIILCFGVLSPRKGLEYLIRAHARVARRFPKCTLVIAGDEPIYYRGYRRQLQALADSLGVRRQVLFTGFVGDDNIHALFLLAEVVVLPYILSVSASGPLSTAMQHHKPVVATRTVYFDHILENGKDALIVSPQNSEELAEGITNLLEDKSMRTKLSVNIKEKAERNSWRKVALLTINVYRRLLTPKIPVITKRQKNLHRQ